MNDNNENKDRSQDVLTPTFGALAPQRATNPRMAKKRRGERKMPDDIYRREKRRPRRRDEEDIVADSPEGTPSLAELARALSNDPNSLPVDLIYQFVHDNIDFIPNYGLHKGGLGALIDGCGNAFDQSDLMVQLLEAAGITTGVNYVMGTIKLSPSQWSNLLGVSQSSPSLASQLLANGGIANSLDGSNNLSLEHCWVQVTIGGTNYAFDPAFKEYNVISGVNLETAMSYDRADFLSDANSGSTLTSDYVQNINDANIQTNLRDYSMNLVNWIKTNMPAASVDQILGGHSIVPTSMPLRQTSLPYHDNTLTTTIVASLPDNVKATIKIQYDFNTSTQQYNISSTFFTDDIYSKRLTLWFDGSLIARLYLDGTQVGNASSAQTLGTSSNMVVTIDHPYPTNFADAVQTASISAGGQTTIGTAWGVSSKQMAAVHQEGQNQAIADGLASGAEALLGRSLLLVWDNFIGQGSKGVEMLSRMSNCTTVMHHFVGTVCHQAYGSGTIKTVNSFLGAWSPSKLATSADTASLGVAASLMFQMLESAAQQQVTGITSADPIQAIKTVNLAGTKIYDAKTSNWTTGTNVKTIMSNAGYTSAVLTTIENSLINANPSWRVAMPETFSITMGSFNNFYAYMGIGSSGSSSGSSTIVGQTWFGSKGVVSGGYQDQPTTNSAASDNA
ncbi:MAG: transglutaminase family protein, partial [Candidatus Obscuribacterales bacterium]|nr:transglutaminase family protein [Candidatus Obscuribacterales bacterium]